MLILLSLIKLTSLKSEYLDIQLFKIIPQSLLVSGMTNADLDVIAEVLPAEDHIVGTAKLMSEEKDSNAGKYFENQFKFAVVSLVDDTYKRKIRQAGAIIVYTDLRTLYFYTNDVFSNAPMQSNIKSNEDVTEVEFSLQSINCL